MADNIGSIGIRGLLPIIASAAVSATVAYFTAITQISVEVARADQRLIALERFQAKGDRFTVRDGETLRTLINAHNGIAAHGTVSQQLADHNARIKVLERESDRERRIKNGSLEFKP